MTDHCQILSFFLKLGPLILKASELFLKLLTKGFDLCRTGRNFLNLHLLHFQTLLQRNQLLSQALLLQSTPQKPEDPHAFQLTSDRPVCLLFGCSHLCTYEVLIHIFQFRDLHVGCCSLERHGTLTGRLCQRSALHEVV